MVTSSARATSRSARSAGVSRASSSSSSSWAIRRCFSRIVRGSASVGCAVTTSSTETLRGGVGDLLARDAVPLEELERLGERLARCSTFALVLAATAHPVVLLGDVGEVEVDRERAEDDRLRLDVERRDRLGERSR